MPELILHHYPTSPFSEKVRLILGLKNLRWHSVIIPMIMPKDDVVALTGGYRKTPILQIGADIYCDSALIADVLEELHPAPTLYPEAEGAEARILAQWADSTLFWTAMPYAFQPATARELFGNAPAEHVQAFLADRKPFTAGAPRLGLAEATGALLVYLERFAGMLADGRPYLLGAVPTIADFSAYHPLWFIRRAPSVAGILERRPRVIEWMDQVAGIGHGTRTDITSADALASARTGAQRARAQLPFQDTHGIAPGEQVTIAPADYGMDPVLGELVMSGPNELALRRSDPRAGEVIVHFPRVGFRMVRAA